MGGNTEEIYDDFEKLLLARARVRVMIFDGDYFNHAGRCPMEFAQQLFGRVRKFKGSLDQDAWLLASWERIASTNSNNWWRFRYFTIEESGL